MSLYALKPAFSRLLQPWMRGLHRWGVTPNHVTWGAVALSASAGVGVAAVFHFSAQSAVFLALPAVQLLRMAFNAIDGAMARQFSMQSDAGAILNECSDVVNDVLLALPFFLVSGLSPAFLALFLFTSVLGEFVGVTTWAVQGERRYDGPLGKADRALVMSGLALVVGLGFSLQLWGDVLVGVLILLSAMTTLRRALPKTSPVTS